MVKKASLFAKTGWAFSFRPAAVLFLSLLVKLGLLFVFSVEPVARFTSRLQNPQFPAPSVALVSSGASGLSTSEYEEEAKDALAPMDEVVEDYCFAYAYRSRTGAQSEPCSWLVADPGFFLTAFGPIPQNIPSSITLDTAVVIYESPTELRNIREYLAEFGLSSLPLEQNDEWESDEHSNILLSGRATVIVSNAVFDGSMLGRPYDDAYTFLSLRRELNDQELFLLGEISGESDLPTPFSHFLHPDRAYWISYPLYRSLVETGGLMLLAAAVVVLAALGLAKGRFLISKRREIDLFAGFGMKRPLLALKTLLFEEGPAFLLGSLVLSVYALIANGIGFFGLVPPLLFVLWFLFDILEAAIFLGTSLLASRPSRRRKEN